MKEKKREREREVIDMPEKIITDLYKLCIPFVVSFIL